MSLNPKIVYRPTILAVLLLCSILGMAQQPLQVLHRHVPLAVTRGQATLAGAMPASQQMHLSIVLPLRNQTELSRLLDRLYDPSSPDYRHFLSTKAFTEEFGLTAEDYQSVVDFVQAHGMTVTDAPENRMLVPVIATVAQVEKAFKVQMNNYRHPTESRLFYSADREPSLALTVPVAHIAGLNNFSIPRPMVIRPQATQNATTSAALGSGPGGAYLASDMRAAYYGDGPLIGSGQTVGLFQAGGYDINDVTAAFDGTATSSANGSNYMLAYTPIPSGTTYNIPVNNVLLDGASGGPTEYKGVLDDAEEVLDIVQALGMAPGLSQVRVYIGSNDVDILNAMASENLAQQLSISWTWNPDDTSTDDFIFEEFAAQGQSVFAASGDYGAYDPIQNLYFPAEDAWVTAVGGTDLTTSGADGSWNAETAWFASGGGVSPDSIPLPSWQEGVASASNNGSTTLRNVPDVAAEANFDNYDCDMGVCQAGYGGTSFAAPRWAGFMALVNQQAVAAGNPSVGFINPAIYALGEGPDYPNVFHDITIGSNFFWAGQTNYYNAVLGYDLVTGWGSPNGQNLIDALAPPASEGFRLSASPQSLTISPGASGITTITIKDVGGFTGDVSLSVSDLPAAVTASFAPNPATGSSVLTLTVDSSAIRGSYLATITGVSGSLTATTSLAVQVDAPGFSIAPLSTTTYITQGLSVSNTICVTDYHGFTGNVSLAMTSGLPAGVTATWLDNPTTGCSELMLTASKSATVGYTLVTITGTSGPESETTTFSLNVTGPWFSLNILPVPTPIADGGTASATVIVLPFGDFTGSVTLTTQQLPPGVTGVFNPVTTTNTSLFTLTASSSAPPGTYGVGILGTDPKGGITQMGFYETVTATPTPAFTLGVSPSTVTITKGGTVTTTVTVNKLNGFTGDVTLSVPDLPPGVSASFAPNPTSGSSVVTLTASSSALLQSTVFFIGGTSGSQTSAVNLFITVKPPPSFTLSASPASVTVARGASITGNIAITPQIGFTGSVNLAVTSVMPNGLTASFTPNPATGTSVLKLSASDTAVPGSYNLTLSGTSGALTVTTQIAVTVTASGFTLSVPPGLVYASPGGAPGTVTVTVNDQDGFTGDVTLAAQGLPNGVTASFAPNPTAGTSVLTLTASSPATPGVANLTITGTSGILTASTNLLLKVGNAGFDLSLSQSSVTYNIDPVIISNPLQIGVIVTPLNGFTGSVTLSAAGMPSGVTASFNPNPTTGASELSLAINNNTAAGSYEIIITGTSCSLTNSTILEVKIGYFSFDISYSPYNVDVDQGASATSIATVTPINGFTGKVTLSVQSDTPPPNGVTVSFAPNPTTGISVITFTASATATLGEALVDFDSTSGALTWSTGLSVTVHPSTISKSFTLSASPASLTLYQSSSVTDTITVNPQNGFTGNVTLTACGESPDTCVQKK